MMNNQNIGIGIFAYNRPSHLRRVLISLENNKIRGATVFLDGPKNKKDILIQKEIIFTIKHNPFINLKLIKKSKNIGLARSIIWGVKYLSNKYENVIVIEDDCIPRKEFFKYIVKTIKSSQYKENLNPICGYQFPEIQKLNKKNLTPIFLNYFMPWGWCVNSNYWREYLKFLKNRKKHNLNDPIIKKIKSIIKINSKDIWSKNFIEFNLIRNKKIIFPSISLIKNIGFDGSGVNSKITNMLSTKYIDIKKNFKINKIFSNKVIEKKHMKIFQKRLKYFF